MQTSWFIVGHVVFTICWNRTAFVANNFVCFETWPCRLYHLLKSNCLCCKGKLGIKFSIFVGIEMSLLQTSLFIVGHKVFNIWWNRNVFVANVFVYSWTCRLYHCLCFFWMQWFVGTVGMFLFKSWKHWLNPLLEILVIGLWSQCPSKVSRGWGPGPDCIIVEYKWRFLFFQNKNLCLPKRNYAKNVSKLA